MRGFNRMGPLAALAAGLLWCTSAAAQESYYLFLEGKGTASLTISRNTRAAFIIDGGDKGKAGIDRATIDGKDVFAFLRPGVDFDYLTIACSHPDSDHMAGLVKLAQDPRILGFKKVFFVDSGFVKEKAGFEKPLFEYFKEAHPRRPAGLAQDIVAANFDAYAVVNQVIPRPEGPPNAELHNLVYEPKNRGGVERLDPHGHAVVHRVTLRENGKVVTVADLDDANDALVARWVEWVKANPEANQPDYLVLPHHASSYTDVPLMAEGVKPRKGVVIPVNPNNQYRHPGMRNLLLSFVTVGPENVYITGDGENVKITPEGLPPITDPNVRRRYYDKFVQRQSALIDRELAALDERLAAAPGSLAEAKARERYAELLDAQADVHEVKKALLNPEWKPDAVLLNRLRPPDPHDPNRPNGPPHDDPGGRPRKPDRPRTGGSGGAGVVAQEDQEKPKKPGSDPDGTGKSDTGPIDGRPKPSQPGSGGAGVAGNEEQTSPTRRTGSEPSTGGRQTKTTEVTRGQTKVSESDLVGRGNQDTRTRFVIRDEEVGNFRRLREDLDTALALRPVEVPRVTNPVPPVIPPPIERPVRSLPRPSRGIRFRGAIRLAPIFGGIILGNETVAAPRVVRSEIRLNRSLGGPVLELTVEGEQGREEMRYEDMTSTELWCAYHFVRPDETMTRRFGATPGECGLVGISRNYRDGRWAFGIHPAIAGTILARDAMRLDMALALADRSLLVVDKPWRNYQWFDAPASVRAVHGNLRVMADGEPADVLLRLRLWGEAPVRPDWYNPPPGDDDARDKAVAAEVKRRTPERLGKEKLDRSPEYLLPRIEQSVKEAVNREAGAAEPPEWYTKAVDKDNALRDEVERRVEAEARSAGIADSPCFKVPRLLARVNHEVVAELSAAELPRWYRDATDKDRAPTEEITRRTAEALAREGLAASPTYQLMQIEEAAEKAVRHEAWGKPKPAWMSEGAQKNQSIGREVERRVVAEAAARDLGESSAMRFRTLPSRIEREVREELEASLGLVDGMIIADLHQRFDALRRIDRFAKVVALLNWLDQTGHLPALPDDIQPERMAISADYRFRDVLKPPPPGR